GDRALRAAESLVPHRPILKPVTSMMQATARPTSRFGSGAENPRRTMQGRQSTAIRWLGLSSRGAFGPLGGPQNGEGRHRDQQGEDPEPVGGPRPRGRVSWYRAAGAGID